MEEKKYKLTEESIEIETPLRHKLYRIEALKDFNNVKAGDLGGFIESEKNLSQKGDCWVYSGYVYDNALVCDNAVVIGKSYIYDNAVVSEHSTVCKDAFIYGNAKLFESCAVSKAHICGNAQIHGYAYICNGYVHDNVEVSNVFIYDKVDFSGDAQICSNKDFLLFKTLWKNGRNVTWTYSNNMWREGDFYGTGEEFVQFAYKESELNGLETERIVTYVEEFLEENKDFFVYKNEKVDVIWTQCMDLLSEYSKHMKSVYNKRMRSNNPLTNEDLSNTLQSFFESINCYKKYTKTLQRNRKRN